MTTRLTLYTSQQAYEGLHELADTKKRFVKIERQALIALLMDHSELLATVKGCGIIVNESEKAA